VRNLQSILEINKVSKSYPAGPGAGQEQPVLKEVSLSVGEGEFVAVMGPSGSGKSTLLYTASGMDQPTSGEVVFDGEKLTSMSEKKRDRLRQQKMGFVFQQIHLLKNYCLMDNIILSPYLAGTESRDVIKRRAIDLMKRTGVAELADRDVTQASGGQLQRVGICRALINRPRIVFGDEPTGALNSASSGEIMDLLGEINESGTTVLLVTHDVRVAARTERVLVMKDGRLAAEKQLGKCPKDKEVIRRREEELTAWLLQMGV